MPNLVSCLLSAVAYFNLECACGEACLVYKVGVGVWFPSIAYAVGFTLYYYTVALELYLGLCVKFAELTILAGNFQSSQYITVTCLQLGRIVELYDCLAVETEHPHRCWAVLRNVAHTVCLVQRKARKAFANRCLLLGVDIGGVTFVAGHYKIAICYLCCQSALRVAEVWPRWTVYA